MPKAFNPHDAYARKARAEGYLARSAYKLQSILKEFSIPLAGKRILDLGAAPGSWTQVASRAAGAGGLVVSVDTEPIKAHGKNVVPLAADVFGRETERQLAPYAPFAMVMSDMAPKTSGIKVHDQAQSEALVLRAIELADAVLAPGGSIIIKAFQGPDTKKLLALLKERFKKAQLHKPPASRDRSFETYLIGLGKQS